MFRDSDWMKSVPSKARISCHAAVTMPNQMFVKDQRIVRHKIFDKMFALIGPQPNTRSLPKSFFAIIIYVIAQWIIRVTFTFSENKLEKMSKKIL